MAESTTNVIAKLERENIELKQQLAMMEAEQDMKADVELVLLGWIKELLKVAPIDEIHAALLKTEIPEYLLHLDKACA